MFEKIETQITAYAKLPQLELTLSEEMSPLENFKTYWNRY